jgi:hypothetical protein
VKKTSQSNSYVNRSTQAKTCRVDTKSYYDQWEKNLSADKTALQLFSNTVKYWYKEERTVCCTSEDYIRNYGMGQLFLKGKASLFCFRQIMNIEIYAEIFCTRASEISWMLCGRSLVFPTRKLPCIIVIFLSSV